MVENRPGLTVLCHAVLIVGIIVVAFPLYVTFVASTHTLDDILSVPMPLTPGDQLWENYSQVLSAGTTKGVTAQKSLASTMKRMEQGRQPAPPTLPDAGRPLKRKRGRPSASAPSATKVGEGTSPLMPGLICVLSDPAGPLSVVSPSLFPSKPAPVQAW